MRFISPASFVQPERVVESAWIEHAPFSQWLVDVMRPQVVVELGSHWGFSYFAFCQAVARTRGDTRCYAIDTWRGDENAGLYGEEVFTDVSEWNRRYAAFSTLIRSTFDEAVASFDHGSIDLLHIDGCHTYEAVRHDFNVWRTRLSSRGVVLLHDTHEESAGFGVHQLWGELRREYASFAFPHGHGLGILAVGSEVVRDVAELTSLADTSLEADGVRAAYSCLGHSIAERELLLRLNANAFERVSSQESEINALHAYADALGRALDEQRDARDFFAYRSGWQRARLQARRAEAAAAASNEENSVWRRLEARTQGLATEHPRLVGAIGRPVRSVIRHRRQTWGDRENDYSEWITAFEPDADQFASIRVFGAALDPRPKVSIVMAVCDPSPEHLRAALESVAAQLYDNWELCIADDASTDPRIRALLAEWETSEHRVRHVRREQRGGISAAVNTALAIASGDYVGFLDHDDVLSPVALLHVVAALHATQAKLVYSDEDILDETGARTSPYFKPSWNPSLLLGQNYLCHFLVCETAALRRIGPFRPELDGAQDWDVVLRLTESVGPDEIVHIPHILYHWRRHPGSTSAGIEAKPYARDAGRRAVAEALSRRAIDAQVDTLANGWNRVHYSVPPEQPSVDVVVPTGLSHPHLGLSLRRLLRWTDYDRMRVLLLVDEEAERQRGSSIPDDVRSDPRLEIVVYPHREFNYAATVNDGVGHGDADIICLFNDDAVVIEPFWLSALVSRVAQAGVGAVGAMLYYPDDTVQHAGVVLGLRDVAFPLHEGLPRGSAGYFGRALLDQDFECVTAACMVVRREAFEGVGGFDTDFAVSYNDVDFCLRLRRAGWRITWTPLAELYHAESSSVRKIPGRVPQYIREVRLMWDRWGDILRSDPTYNPNLSLAQMNKLAWPPRTSAPWTKASGCEPSG